MIDGRDRAWNITLIALVRMQELTSGDCKLTVSVHNPDQYMAALRTIIAQGRKRIGLLVGAGASAGMAKPDGTYPLIPAVSGPTD